MEPTIAGALQLQFLVLLFAALAFVPGWWAAHRLPGDGLQKLVASCLIGLTELAAFEILDYGFRLNQWLAVTFTLAAAAISARPLVGDLRRGRFALDGLATWVAAAMFLVAASTQILVHGLPNEFWDWCEHWVRARVFLEGAPISTRIGIYGMASRGPLFNAASALLLAIVGSSSYWVFQVASITLNTTVCLPFALLLRDVAGLRQRTALLGAGVMCVVLPYFFWNATYTWTKLLTATFILGSVAFYTDALRRARPAPLAWSLAFLAPGFLCHYLAFVYAAVLGAHLAWVHLRRGWWPRELAKVTAASALLVAPWFGYLVANLGFTETFFSNTTTGNLFISKGQDGRPGPPASVIASNICLNFIPRAVCRTWLPADAEARCEWVDSTADHAETRYVAYPPWLYWNGIYGVLRASGACIAVAALFAALAGRTRAPDGEGRVGSHGDRQDWGFLVYFLLAGHIANVLPVRWYDSLGTFNENLHAWAVVLLVVIAAGFRRVPRPLAAALTLFFLAECLTVDAKLLALQERALPLRFRCADFVRTPGLMRARDIRGVVTSRSFGCYLDLYHNTFIKVEYAAVYLYDQFLAASSTLPWVLAALGLLILATGYWSVLPPRDSRGPGPLARADPARDTGPE